MNRRIGAIGALALGIALLVTPAARAAGAGAGIIHVPSSFDPTLSDTRTSGQYAVDGTALHVWTTDTSSEAKVAEYVDTNVPLSSLQGEPALNGTLNSGTIPPGFQLQVDFNNDGTIDGILVGEPTYYGNDWWASNGSAQFVKDGAPSHAGGSGSANHGTLDQWRANFSGAVVKAFGFSLGSSVLADYTLNSIDFNGTTYTFTADVVLTSKAECKNGGWATSYPQTFTNQGDCVSYFASSGSKNRNRN